MPRPSQGVTTTVRRRRTLPTASAFCYATEMGNDDGSSSENPANRQSFCYATDMG